MTVSKELVIDRSKLDLEVARQSQLHERYKKVYIRILKAYKRAERRFTKEKALIAKAIRSDPEKYGIIDIRLTETAVTQAMPLHKDYRHAHEKYLYFYLRRKDADEDMEIVRSRTFLLNNLTRMLETGYMTPTSMSIEED